MIKITITAPTRKLLDMFCRLATAYRDARAVTRIHAIRLLAEGHSVPEVASLLSVAEQSVRNWVQEFLLKGAESLLSLRPPGRPGRLSKSQKQELLRLLKEGPLASGYHSACWDSVMIADLAWRKFQVRYHPHHICRLLAHLGWSYQKARFLSDHLDPSTRDRWLQETWPQIIQRAREEKATILFGDECGFAQWGSLFYTWAPKGEQPCVPTTGIRKRHKLFGAFHPFTGQLFTQGVSGKFTSESYIEFLRYLLDRVGGRIILIQDGAPYHTAKLVKEFLAQQQGRLSVYQLPAYSPDFNPIEQVWKKVKKDATHLRYFPLFADLVASVQDTVTRLEQTPAALLSLVKRYCPALLPA